MIIQVRSVEDDIVLSQMSIADFFIENRSAFSPEEGVAIIDCLIIDGTVTICGGAQPLLELRRVDA